MPFEDVWVRPRDPVLLKRKADPSCVAPFYVHKFLVLLPEYHFVDTYPDCVLPCIYCDRGTSAVHPHDFGYKPLMDIEPAMLFFKRLDCHCYYYYNYYNYN